MPTLSPSILGISITLNFLLVGFIISKIIFMNMLFMSFPPNTITFPKLLFMLPSPLLGIIISFFLIHCLLTSTYIMAESKEINYLARDSGKGANRRPD